MGKNFLGFWEFMSHATMKVVKITTAPVKGTAKAVKKVTEKIKK